MEKTNSVSLNDLNLEIRNLKTDLKMASVGLTVAAPAFIHYLDRVLVNTSKGESLGVLLLTIVFGTFTALFGTKVLYSHAELTGSNTAKSLLEAQQQNLPPSPQVNS